MHIVQCKNMASDRITITNCDPNHNDSKNIISRAELMGYQFVPRAQTVTDETDESGGSEEYDDEVGAIDGSRITRNARSKRTGNRSKSTIYRLRVLSYRFQENI